MIYKLRPFILFLIFAFYAATAFSMDFELEAHYDTYPTIDTEDDFNIGVSCRFSEQLKNNLFIDANLIYKKANKYLAYCAGRISYNRFSFRTGIALDLRESVFTPGVLISCDFRLFKILSITTNLLTTFSMDNIMVGSVFDSEAGVIFHLRNSNVKLVYNYRKELEDEYNLSYHYGVFDLITYESGFPFRIGLNAKGGYLLDTRDAEYFDFVIEAGARLEFVSARHGSYFIAGSANVFKYSDLEAPITFAISAGVHLILN